MEMIFFFFCLRLIEVGFSIPCTESGPCIFVTCSLLRISPSFLPCPYICLVHESLCRPGNVEVRIALSSNATTLGSLGRSGFLRHTALRNCIILSHLAASGDSCGQQRRGGGDHWISQKHRGARGLFGTRDLEPESSALLLKVWVALVRALDLSTRPFSQG